MKEGERISNPNNALDSIKVSHRPKGGNEWLEGYGVDPRTAEDISYESRSNIGDTGTKHPHGTKYKPKMVRFQSSGTFTTFLPFHSISYYIHYSFYVNTYGTTYVHFRQKQINRNGIYNYSY